MGGLGVAVGGLGVNVAVGGTGVADGSTDVAVAAGGTGTTTTGVGVGNSLSPALASITGKYATGFISPVTLGKLHAVHMPDRALAASVCAASNSAAFFVSGA